MGEVMSSISNVAIIGCGIFGASIALRLSEAGFTVTVFEKNAEIMKGASLNNQNRLHLGFHYPRDDETAAQCIKGFYEFKSQYAESISDNFDNIYCISEQGSLTTTTQYKEFCDRVGLNYEQINKTNYPINIRNVDSAFLTEEVVYDSKVLRTMIEQKISLNKISLVTNCEIVSLEDNGAGYTLFNSASAMGNFDAVVNCCYADINRLTQQIGFPVEERQYEYTAVPIISTDIPRIGVTIMDGKFMTLLPFGKSNHFLLYHVEHTVIDRVNDFCMPESWRTADHHPFNLVDKDEFYAAMLKDSEFFLPDLKGAKLEGFLHGPRMVLARKDDTDARPSLINSYSERYHTVFSGKIDHSMWVAEEITQRLIKARA